jgi:hypothetical protein
MLGKPLTKVHTLKSAWCDNEGAGSITYLYLPEPLFFCSRSSMQHFKCKSSIRTESGAVPS